MQKLLVVDDDAEMIWLYRQTLSQHYRVTAVTGEDLLNHDMLRELIEEADLVLSDYDGVPFDYIKNRCKFICRPLLMVSGNAEKLNPGVPSLAKPFRKHELLSKLEEISQAA